MQASERLFTSQVRLNLFGGLFGLSVNMIVMALRLGILALGTWLILQQRFTVGGLVAFLGIMGEVVGPATSLSDVGQRIQASGGALVRINEVLDAVPEVIDDPDAPPLPPLTGDIRLVDLSFSYTTGNPTLEDIDLRITAGSKVAFVGPTGAGKSSLLQLLMRFYDPEAGRIEFDGRDVRHTRLSDLRDQIGSSSKTRSSSTRPCGRTSPSASRARRTSRWRPQRVQPSCTSS